MGGGVGGWDCDLFYAFNFNLRSYVIMFSFSLSEHILFAFGYKLPPQYKHLMFVFN